MKHVILLFILIAAQNTLATGVTGANQLITKALGLRSNEAILKGFAGPARKPIRGSLVERECSLRVNLDDDYAYIQLWINEEPGYSHARHLEYVHGEDEPDVFGEPKVLEKNDVALKIETDVTRPQRVFYPDGAKEVQTLTIQSDQNSQVRSVEISVKLRDGKPNEISRLTCQFPIAM